MTYKTQGERIALKMKREGLKQADVARDLGTSPQNVRAWCDGFCVPSMKFHERIEAWLKNGRR